MGRNVTGRTMVRSLCGPCEDRVPETGTTTSEKDFTRRVSLNVSNEGTKSRNEFTVEESLLKDW